MSDKAISFTKSLAAAINCSMPNTIIHPDTGKIFDILVSSNSKGTAYKLIVDTPVFTDIMRVERLVNDWYDSKLDELKRFEAFKVIDSYMRKGV